MIFNIYKQKTAMQIPVLESPHLPEGLRLFQKSPQCLVLISEEKKNFNTEDEKILHLNSLQWNDPINADTPPLPPSDLVFIPSPVCA